MQGARASCSRVVCDVARQKMELTLLVWDNQAQNLGPFCWNLAPLLIRKEVWRLCIFEQFIKRAEPKWGVLIPPFQQWVSVPSPVGPLVGCDGSPF